MKKRKGSTQLMANLFGEEKNTMQEIDASVVCAFKNFVNEEY